MAEINGMKWWAWQGLNLRPLRCQGRDTRHFPQKTGVFHVPNARTARERMVIRGNRYRTLTAQGIEARRAATTKIDAVHESPVRRMRPYSVSIWTHRKELRDGWKAGLDQNRRSDLLLF